MFANSIIVNLENLWESTEKLLHTSKFITSAENHILLYTYTINYKMEENIFYNINKKKCRTFHIKKLLKHYLRTKQNLIKWEAISPFFRWWEESASIKYIGFPSVNLNISGNSLFPYPSQILDKPVQKWFGNWA